MGSSSATKGRGRGSRIKERIASGTTPQLSRCSILGCSRKPSGVSVGLCRLHILRKQRWGSPFCPPPRAATLNPFVKAALTYIKANRNDLHIKVTLEALRDLLASAGPAVPAHRLYGMSADARSNAALARLREGGRRGRNTKGSRGVRPEQILARVLAVHALEVAIPAVCHRVRTWRFASLSKCLIRLRSGTHSVWRDDDGKVLSETHRYPRKAGQVLQALGAKVVKACEWVLSEERHVAAVVALRVARYGPAKVADLPQVFPAMVPSNHARRPPAPQRGRSPRSPFPWSGR
jgi:hypothetical protein